MKAFLGKKEVKAKYLSRVRAHQKANAIIKGQYWANGKGCAIGCTIHSSDHKEYEEKLGIPEWLAQVEDEIFEGLPNERAVKWPNEFLSAIEVGADLNKIEAPFVIFILESLFDNFDRKEFPNIGNSIQTCIDLYKKGNLTESAKWSAARIAAESAAGSAMWSVEWRATRSAAEQAAWSAANSAARIAARIAARSVVKSAARIAAWSAARSVVKSAACSAAERVVYVNFADELLKLLKECK